MPNDGRLIVYVQNEVEVNQVVWSISSFGPSQSVEKL